MRKPLVIIFGIMSAVMLLAIACGSDEANPDATATTAPPPTVLAGQITPEPTAAPTAVPPTSPPASTGGGDGPTAIAIDVDGDNLKFATGALSAAAGSEVVVTFNNSSGINSHNWALVEAGTKDAVATDGLAAGQDNNWLPVGDSRIIGSTILLGPGESGEATFTAPSTGPYQFVCTFPGHNFTMFGTFTVN